MFRQDDNADDGHGSIEVITIDEYDDFIQQEISIYICLRLIMFLLLYQYFTKKFIHVQKINILYSFFSQN